MYPESRTALGMTGRLTTALSPELDAYAALWSMATLAPCQTGTGNLTCQPMVSIQRAPLVGLAMPVSYLPPMNTRAARSKRVTLLIICGICQEPIKRNLKKVKGRDRDHTFHGGCFAKRGKSRTKRARSELHRIAYAQGLKEKDISQSTSPRAPAISYNPDNCRWIAPTTKRADRWLDGAADHSVSTEDS